MRFSDFTSALRIRSLPAICWIVTLGFCTCGLQSQTQQFSSSAEYKSMLEELHHDPVRPSRMSAGTLFATVQQVHVEADETASGLRIETAAWRLEIGKAQWGLRLTNKKSGLIWNLAGQGGLTWTQGANSKPAQALGKIQRIERRDNSWRMQVETAGSGAAPATLEIAVITPTVIRLSIQAPKWEGEPLDIALHFAGAGPFFGLGERFDRIKLDGLKTDLLPQDLLGQAGGHNWTYIPIPFLFTPRGLGLYLDVAVESAFDLSTAEQGKFSVLSKTPSADAYLFVGEPKDILQSYTSLTGRTPVPPPWALGVWICSYQSPQSVMAEARKLKQNDIPANAIWTFDVMGKGDIMGWPLWWTGYYPHPSQFTAQLHQMGFKVLTYVHPYLRSVLDPYNLPNPSYEEGLRTGLFVLNAEGQPSGPGFEPHRDGNIDFTKPANVDWWERKIRNILLDDGFDGWMEDFGEWVNQSDRFAAGVTGRTMANLNPLFYHKITYEITHEAKPDAVEFVRSGYAGSQGYTQVVWGGDQFPNWTQDYGLPSVVRAGITAGLSGFSVWAPDIAANGRLLELWTRWVEFGALTPVMRNHLWDKPEGAVNLWTSAQTMDTFRAYAKLHASLFPYLFTYAREAARDGLPIMRHPLLNYPDDATTYDCTDEYLLGDDILVAPVVEQGVTSRSLYLPAGSWVDYWTGEILAGGRQAKVAAPLEHIPIFVRAGSILPFAGVEPETLIWRIFPTAETAERSFALYDDTLAKVTQTRARTEIQVGHAGAARRVELMLPAGQKPRRIVLGGKSLLEISGASEGGGKVGWWMDAASHTLRIVFQARDFEVGIDW